MQCASSGSACRQFWHAVTTPSLAAASSTSTYSCRFSERIAMLARSSRVAEEADRVSNSRDMTVRFTNPMNNANRFKLGLFSINADGGTAFTKVANRWRANWSEIEALAKTADAAGLEFILPI